MTAEDLYNQVLLACPVAPAFLARQWVQTAYARACRIRDWSHLRVITTLKVGDQKTGTVSVTLDSAAVTGAGLVFAATDVGRQFRVGQQLYTILSVAAGVATLDRPYDGVTSAAAAGRVYDAFITVPDSFDRWLIVVDPVTQRPLATDVPEIKLEARDPARTDSGDPQALVSKGPSPVAAAAGGSMYELWPHQLTARRFNAIYFRRGETLDDDTVIAPPLAGHEDVLIDGALSMAAKWPGTETRKNPYFDLKLARELAIDFAAGVDRIEVKDEERFPTWVPQTYLERRYFGGGGVDWDRSHDTSIWD